MPWKILNWLPLGQWGECKMFLKIPSFMRKNATHWKLLFSFSVIEDSLEALQL